LEDEVIGKPTDEDHARQILRALSGKAHRVITGVCLMRGRCIQTFTEQTQVFFYTLSDDQINYYVTRYQPMDKAGAYAIQEWIGLTGIEKIEGDYFNVVGLPVGRLIQEIAMFDAKAQTSY
jgi:septum formation protein